MFLTSVQKWECHLPERYILASTPSKNSINLPITLQTTDTGDLISDTGLVDSGASGRFIDHGFAANHKLTLRRLQRPIPIYNIDGTLNEHGSVHEIADVILRYKDHTEHTQFAITNLGKHNIVLGFDWLKEHNPKIDWRTQEVKMSHCPSQCCTCFLNQK